jgi:hypothetical protein
MTALRLQFDPALIPAHASRYQYEDDARVTGIGRAAGDRGWFTRDEFLEVCEWKTKRIRSRVARNSERAIERATRLALAQHDPVRALAAMESLKGVGKPVGSVFLHLAHTDPFPILDYRALEAFGVRVAGPVSQALWVAYVGATRDLATRVGVDARTLDRALWQWSKEQSRDRRVRTHPSAAGRATQPLSSRRPPAEVDVVIVGCVSSKQAGPAPAKDLYVSPLWEKRRRYAESSGRPWVIFSAEHGILEPDQVIDYYDVALKNLPIQTRRSKGEQATDQLEELFGPLRGKTFEIHAGAAYVDALRGPLKRSGASLKTPLNGLSIGYQLQWYG